jgi:HEAT repeat protein
MRGISSFARAAKFTAIQALSRVESPAAEELLQAFVSAGGSDPTLKALANSILHRSKRGEPHKILEGLTAGDRDSRIIALHRTGELGLREALPHVRRLAATDPSMPVRHRAWFAQAALLDVEAVPLWISALERRTENDDAAREAIHALGYIGDNRAIAPLLDAFEQGFKPTLMSEALQSFGPPILPALLDRIDAQPEVAERKAAQTTVATLDPAGVREAVAARLRETDATSLAARGLAYLKLLSVNKELKRIAALDMETLLNSVSEPAPKAFSELRRSIARAATGIVKAN